MADRPDSPRSPHRKESILLAAMLLDARVSAGLTQLDAASRLGVAQTLISKIEVGERKIELVIVRDLCRIYGIDFLKFIAAYDSAASRGRSTPPARLIRKDKGVRRR